MVGPNLPETWLVQILVSMAMWTFEENCVLQAISMLYVSVLWKVVNQ
jgi:hypothetical protein